MGNTLLRLVWLFSTAPNFVYEPANITAQPVNGTASAAFSCTIQPADDLVEIQWYFDAMSFGSGSGMGLSPGPSSGILSNDTEGVTIHQPADPGTSILILDSVGNDFEGFYSCVAVFPDQMRTSSEAALIFNRKPVFKLFFTCAVIKAQWFCFRFFLRLVEPLNLYGCVTCLL